MDSQTDIENLIKEMADIQLTWNDMVRENSMLQDKLSAVKVELDQCKSIINRGEMELKKKQVFVEQLQPHVSEIPRMKQRKVELENKIASTDELLLKKDVQISKLVMKHEKDMKEAINGFDKIKSDIISSNMEKSLSLQNILLEQNRGQLTNLQKDKNIEINKQKVILSEIEKKIIDQESQNGERYALYETEMENIRNQLNIAKRAATQNKPGSAEIFRKKIQSMQRHYECELQKLKKKLQSHDIPFDNTSYETTPSKKKVSFVLPNSPTVESKVGKDISFSEDKGNANDDNDYRNLFLDTAIKFGSEKVTMRNNNSNTATSASSMKLNCHSKPVFKFSKKQTVQMRSIENDTDVCEDEGVVTPSIATLKTNSNLKAAISDLEVTVFPNQNKSSTTSSSLKHSPYVKRFVLASKVNNDLPSAMSASELIDQNSRNTEYSFQKSNNPISYSRKRKLYSQSIGPTIL